MNECLGPFSRNGKVVPLSLDFPSPTGCPFKLVFFLKMFFIFLNSASSAVAALVFDLPIVYTH